MPQVRRPGGKDWEDISWEQAYAEIAQRVKKTRDELLLIRTRTPQAKTVGTRAAKNCFYR